MKKQNKLYRLIHRLKKSEKRHFSLYAKTFKTSDSDKSYLYLFQLIDKHKIQDDATLKKFFLPNELKQLPSKKVYLYKKILESLVMNSKSQIDSLYTDILNARQLIRRNLFKDASSVLSESLKKNKKLKSSFVEVDNYLYQYIIAGLDPTNTKHNVLEILYNIEEQLEIQRIETKYRILKVEIFQQTQNINNEKTLQQQILNNPLLSTSSYLKNIVCHFSYFDIKNMIFQYLGDWDKLQKNAKESFDYFVERYKEKEFKSINIYESWSNLLQAYLAIGDQKKFLIYISYFNETKKTNNQIVFYHYYKYLNIIKYAIQFKDAQIIKQYNLESEIERKINDAYFNSYHQRELLFLLAFFHFRENNLVKSVDVIPELWGQIDSNTEILCSILYFLIQIEQENYQYFLNIVNSFQRKLKSKKLQEKSLNKILKLLEKYAKESLLLSTNNRLLQSFLTEIVLLIEAEENRDFTNLYSAIYLKLQFIYFKSV